MPNHFHLLIRVKPIGEMRRAIEMSKSGSISIEKELKKFDDSPVEFLSKQFSNLFSSYTQAFNKQQGRMGSLFMKGFKRKPVEDELYLRKLVHYIHHNPVEAGLCSNPIEWSHSSYNEIVSSTGSLIKRDELIQWFDDLEGFQSFHKLGPQLTKEE